MDSENVKGKPLTKEETKMFLELIEASSIITKKTTNATNKLKNDEWVRIADHFNSTAYYPRTPQQLRLKWENLKKNARKRSILIRLTQNNADGGPRDYIPPDEILEKVANLLGTTVSGHIVPFSDDQTINEDIDEDKSFNNYRVDDSYIGVGCGDEDSKSYKDTKVPMSNRSSTVDPNSKRMGLNMWARKHNTSRPVKKKIQGDDSRTARNTAIAEYYSAKRRYLDAQITNMDLLNENTKLQNIELQLKNEKLQLEIQQLKLDLEKSKKMQ